MKRILLLAAVALCLCSCGKKGDEGYRINVEFTGDLSAHTLDTVYLRLGRAVDTAVVVDGKACFEGRMQTPNDVILFGKTFGTKGGQILFFLENCQNDMTVTLSPGGVAKFKLKGGEYQRFYDSLVTIRRAIVEGRDYAGVIGAYRASTDEVEKAKLLATWQSISDELDAALKNAEILPEEVLDARIAAFKAVPEYAENTNLKLIEETAAQLKAMKIGNKVEDFVQNDPQGNPVKFSDVYSKNKLTMVDFWASWCGPCRAFNPTLMKIYEKYHDKGFEVLAVSYDSKKDAWIKCIEDEKLPWLHVSDLKGWGNATAKMFYIKGIPQNLFVDQNGALVGYRVPKHEIEKFIEEHLGK